MREKPSFLIQVDNMGRSGRPDLENQVRLAYLEGIESDYRNTEWMHKSKDILAFELVLQYLTDSVGQVVTVSQISNILLDNSPTLAALNQTRRKRTINGRGISSFHHIEAVFKIDIGSDFVFIDSKETAIKLFKSVVKYYSHDMGKFFIRRTITPSEKEETPSFDYVIDSDETTLHARSSSRIFVEIASAIGVFSQKEIKQWDTAVKNHHGLQMAADGFLSVHELAQNIEGAVQEFFELSTADMGGAFGSFHFIPENVQEMLKLASHLAEEHEDVQEFNILYLLLMKTLLPKLIRGVSEYIADIGEKIKSSIEEFKLKINTLAMELTSTAIALIKQIEAIIESFQLDLNQHSDGLELVG